jgi:hypothetical protein
MMRWVFFSIAVIVVAAIATVGSTFLPADTSKNLVLTGNDKPSGPPASIAVEGELVYDFGKKSQWTEGNHSWTIVNNGKGEARLNSGETSCSCTKAKFPEGDNVTLAPGKSTTVTVGYNTKTWDHFHHWAHILIQNDPSQQQVELVIEGKVFPPVVTFPSEPVVNMLKIKNDAPHPYQIAVGSQDIPDMKITEVLTNPAIFSTEIQPLNADECKQFKLDKGSKVIVNLKPGAVLGPFTEELVIKTDHPKKPEIKMTLTGKVEGPIELMPERFRLLDVTTKGGGSQKLKLWVRGQKTTKFTVEKKPKDLDVQITPTGNGSETSSQYEVTVTVPPGQSTKSNVNDEIILKTDHPNASEVKIPVAVYIRSS